MTSVHSDTDLRMEAVRDGTRVNGIDFLEVLPGQSKLAVRFLHPLPGQTDGVPADGTVLTKAHVLIEGGDRVRGIRALSSSTADRVLTVAVSGPGDFSTYRLRLVDPVTGRVPLGFDPQLSGVDFSFKAGCPIRFDCRPRDECPPPARAPEGRDHLAKDFDSFRQLMLDRLATTIPDWTERNPADLQFTLVDLLAYVGDRLSYEQDAIATEAYLGTARSRVSVRRHARLLGYRMHEGCAARAFVHVHVDALQPFAAHRQFLTGPPGDPETLVFEALHPLTAAPERNEIAFHTWTDVHTCLPRGATRATLAGDPAPALAVGDFLLLEEVLGSASGEEADKDRSHRHVVRLTDVSPGVDPLDATAVVEVAWAEADALPFPFCISAVTESGGLRRRSVCGVARGNIVLVDHGASVPAPVPLSLALDVADRWRPPLPEGRPTWAVAFDATVPARDQLAPDPREARARVAVQDADGNDYDPVPDLLGSFAEDAHFVVEVEEDGSTTLRFGDGTYGREPLAASDHLATYRSGHGAHGNVGPEAITLLHPPVSGVSVTNPLAAAGGVDPEPTERVRLDAPQAFRVQERAVTESDYATILTERAPGIQRAAGRMRWTGSWYTAFVSVDRLGGREVDRPHREQVRGFLEPYRMAGVDVEVSRPRPVPLELELAVCAHPNRFTTDVERDVLDALSSRVLPSGVRGLFHPDHFTFGTPVHLSRVYAAVLAVPGVATVRATKFRRYGEPDRGELATMVLRVLDLEIAQLANDPDVPERGVLTVSVGGGR